MQIHKCITNLVGRVNLFQNFQIIVWDQMEFDKLRIS